MGPHTSKNRASIKHGRSNAMRNFAVALIALSVGLGVSMARAAAGDIWSLGTLGGTVSGSSAINDAGQVIGSSRTTGDAADHAFIFTGVPGSGGAIFDLGPINVRDINNSGQISGTTSAGHAGRYSGVPGSGGAMADLGTLGGTLSGGIGINASGQVVGTSQTTGDIADHAFLYTGTPGAGGAMADLGTLGGTYNVAWAINNGGHIVGQSGTAGDAAGHAYLYSGVPGAGGAMVDLGTLGGTNSVPYAINNVGQVAGTSGITGDTEFHAFLYTGTPGAGGAMVDLGTLGGDTSEAFGINDSGFVVGYSKRSDGPQVWPTLWLNDAAHTAIDLDAWLDTTNPAMGSFWFLGDSTTTLIDINNNGLITGSGYYSGPGGDGFTTAFILDASSLVVPEPSTFALAGLALSALLLRTGFRRLRARSNVGVN